MKPPRVVSESRRTILEKPPPPKERSRPHHWLREERRIEVEEALAGTEALPLYISKTAEAKMRDHSTSCGRRGLEALGLLLGDVYVHSERRHTIVSDVVTTDLRSTGVSVSFDRSGFEKLFERLDSAGSDYVIVGWYHSHPGHTCFMSPRDVQTQRSMFREDFHFAIVIDPIVSQIEAFTLSGMECVPAQFAVYWEEDEDPYVGSKNLPLKPR
jgi:proteasome lid subunit RPN8/RPN11